MMTMNDQGSMEPREIPLTPPDITGAPANKEKRKISAAERLLLPVALAIGILYDRLMFAPLFQDSDYMLLLYGVFWLCYLVLFYMFYWNKIAHNRVSWYVAGCCAALCVWNLIFNYDGRFSEYSMLTYVVIPAVLMAHAQFSTGNYRLNDAGEIALAWLRGWFIKPFSGILAFFEAAGSLVLGENKSTARKAALGIGITLPLLGVIIPLLCGADQVFGYFIRRFIGSWNFGSLFFHIVVIAIAFTLFYSFLWNTGLNKSEKEKTAPKAALSIDELISYIVLGTVNVLYVLFCAVQFTYLFVRAGLPNGITYSEYAREGFSQTVMVCAINLLIFGVFLRFGTKKKVSGVFLAVLLALTFVMLFSGFIRLKLYIDAYGLTWLRIFSAWFIIYLAAVIIVCAVRMMREKLPAIALCALILLGWYVALGYSNPDALISRYNQSHNYDVVETR